MAKITDTFLFTKLQIKTTYQELITFFKISKITPEMNVRCQKRYLVTLGVKTGGSLILSPFTVKDNKIAASQGTCLCYVNSKCLL